MTKKDNLFQIGSRQRYLNWPSTANFQNLMNADVLILFMRSWTPLTTFSKELGKIIKLSYLQLSSLSFHLIDDISFEVCEEELARWGTVGVLGHINHWHFELLDILLGLWWGVVASIVHHANRSLSPIGSIPVQGLAKFMEQKSFGISVSIDLAQCEKNRTVRVNGNHESDSWMHCTSTNCVGDISFSPILTPEVFLIYPRFIDVDDPLAFFEIINHPFAKHVSEDNFFWRVGVDINPSELSVSQA